MEQQPCLAQTVYLCNIVQQGPSPDFYQWTAQVLGWTTEEVNKRTFRWLCEELVKQGHVSKQNPVMPVIEPPAETPKKEKKKKKKSPLQETEKVRENAPQSSPESENLEEWYNVELQPRLNYYCNSLQDHQQRIKGQKNLEKSLSENHQGFDLDEWDLKQIQICSRKHEKEVKLFLEKLNLEIQDAEKPKRIPVTLLASHREGCSDLLPYFVAKDKRRKDFMEHLQRLKQETLSLLQEFPSPS